MHISYNAASDTLTISIAVSPETYAGTREVAEGVLVDFDNAGNPQAIEILAARERYREDRLSQVEDSDVWLSLSEAAESVGLSPDTLRAQIRNGRLQAEKKGGVWLVKLSSFQEYLASRKYNAKELAT